MVLISIIWFLFFNILLFLIFLVVFGFFLVLLVAPPKVVSLSKKNGGSYLKIRQGVWFLFWSLVLIDFSERVGGSYFIFCEEGVWLRTMVLIKTMSVNLIAYV